MVLCVQQLASLTRERSAQHIPVVATRSQSLREHGSKAGNTRIVSHPILVHSRAQRIACRVSLLSCLQQFLLRVHQCVCACELLAEGE